ncbi:MAG TPA: GNVR domain-containing protein [Methylomusa anaerophila]|uniref:Tyrosine-protein kinase etk n=1 Tax=Methylomusa anaerophila TaxID=1930071 RepID=A0A348AI17_9FIRM|nr:GNVR domain-containing protein [Methylomusa anaerophila]BBB90715.1 tyrosine-protein kinase etk [Methylomusa anaerophila]HML88682.1 GNVR domain-containing protein [Methylomusa anaerophila]
MVNGSIWDKQNIIRIAIQRKGLILAVFILTVMLTVGMNALLPKVYEAETTVRIKQPKALANSLLADQPVEGGNTKQLMQSNTEILKSRTVAQAVIAKLPQDRYAAISPNDILRRISTSSINGEILKIKVQGKTPEEAQTIATALMDAFVQRITGLSRREQKAAREFIGERLLEAKAELETAESAFEDYKREQKIVSPADETKVMVENLAGMKKANDENTTALAAAAAKLSNIREQLNRQKQGVLADNQLIQQQKNKLAELEGEKAGLLAKYTADHPQVQSVQASIDKIKVDLNEEISRVVNGDAPSTNHLRQGLLENEIQVGAELSTASARKTATEQIIASDQQDLAKIPAKEHGLAIVERDVTVAREKYVMLAKRHEEARINEVMQPLEVQVIDEPDASPSPVQPKKTLNLLLGAVIGLVSGIGLAVLGEHVQKKMATEEDVKRYLDLPVIGMVPDFTDEPRPGYIRYRNKLRAVFKWLSGQG